MGIDEEESEMSEFISTDAGYLNARSIIQMWEAEERGSAAKPITRTRIEYRDAQGEAQRTWSWTKPEDVGGAIIPAEPGYYIITPWYDEEAKQYRVWRMPIVAWRIQNNFTSPVCIDNAAMDSQVILAPNGQVFDPCAGTFNSLDAYLANHAERVNRKQAAVAPHPAANGVAPASV